MTYDAVDIKLPAIAEKCADAFSNITPTTIEPYGFNWIKIS